jgi:hypothetical protein
MVRYDFGIKMESMNLLLAIEVLYMHLLSGT